jgi:hypothetical protein
VSPKARRVPSTLKYKTGRKKPRRRFEINSGQTENRRRTREQDCDEIDEVELTLTKPLPERAVKLKEFLDTHPDSKARPRAIELLISTHAASAIRS